MILAWSEPVALNQLVNWQEQFSYIYNSFIKQSGDADVTGTRELDGNNVISLAVIKLYSIKHITK